MTGAESLIRAAWAHGLLAADEAITSHSCLECDELAEYFGGTTWAEHTDVNALREHAVALSLFTSSAFCHFLPAFLLASLADPAGADIIVDNVCFAFTPSPEVETRALERLRVLTPAQREALGEWFNELLSRGLFDRAEVESAKQFLGRT